MAHIHVGRRNPRSETELLSLGRSLQVPNGIAVLIEGDQPVLTDL